MDETMAMSAGMPDGGRDDRADVDATFAAYASRGVDPETLAALFPTESAGA